MTEPFNGFRLDKAAISCRGLHAPDDSYKYWWDKTPQERLAALEYLRMQAWPDYDPHVDRMERKLKVIDSSASKYANRNFRCRT